MKAKPEISLFELVRSSDLRTEVGRLREMFTLGEIVGSKAEGVRHRELKNIISVS